VRLSIRPADSADYDRIIGELDAWWGGRAMSTMLPRLFFTHFRPWTFIAEDAEGIAGFLAGFQSQSDLQQAYCHFIGVHPRARGRGVGEALYQRLCADALARGCREVLAVTSPLNTGSIAFHRRLGFVPLPGDSDVAGVPFTPDYDGPGEDRVRLHLPLPAPNPHSQPLSGCDWREEPIHSARVPPRPSQGERGSGGEG
jgi:GNAT superfamily N-acetyltransferase